MSKLNYNNFDCLLMGNLWPGGCIMTLVEETFIGGQPYRSVAWAFILSVVILARWHAGNKGVL